ncbi:MAG: metallophosphoesterase [Polyangiaceae bacterium]
MERLSIAGASARWLGVLGVCLGVGGLVLACSEEDGASPGAGAGGDGGSAGSAAAGSGGIAGTASGGSAGGGDTCSARVSKGPWSTRVTKDSAVVRWESCDETASAELRLTPEQGGAEQTFQSEVAPFEIENRYTSIIPAEIPDDLPGTYYMHEAKLSGLAPGCYGYVLAADESRHGRFCTARASGEDFNFMAIADTNPGLTDNTELILEQVALKGYDFTVHAGDLQYYASGLETWASWFPSMQPMLSQGAFFPAIGNHESEKPDEYDQYYTRFFGDSGFEGTSAYYVFDTGGVSFFSLDTEIPLQDGADPAQYDWFAAKLKEKSEAAGYRFSVVYLHRPLITCGDTGALLTERYLLEPLFEQYNVRLVLQGHMHGYERFTVPLGSRELTYVTTGGGGGAIGNVDENIDREFCNQRTASGAFNEALWVQVTQSEIKAQAIDQTGAAKDEFTISLQ